VKFLKKNLTKIKKVNKVSVSNFIDRTIEHRLFKPIVISIITSFILFQGFEYTKTFILDYQESKARISKSKPIKINISGQGAKFNLEEDQIIEHLVRSGDTLSKILSDNGVDDQSVLSILNAVKKVFNPRSITTGNGVIIKYHVKIGYDSVGVESSKSMDRRVVVDSVTIVPSVEERIVVSRKNDGEYDAREVKVKLLRYVSRYFGTLKDGLYNDGVASGISATSMMNMIGLYSYDVDFERDIRSGDKFEMLVESFYSEDGKKMKDGNVLYSSLTLQNRVIDIYMHKVDGRVEYFDPKGNSVRKSLLRTPINGAARISSGFGLRRHPILGYSKMHKGVDFAAGTGTPILAAGSGTIVHFGVKGGYGNYVKIKHNADYSTAYGHASRFNKKFRLGSKVKQGDVVAYVGTTGRSTGPHLHFEVIYKGRQINPSKVKATSGLRLSGKELARFENSKSEIDKYRKNIPNQIKR
jgi:murein DD-endopeptidase MepM/ murein hydrolase activator NlpD